jgi:hypothetical protein
VYNAKSGIRNAVVDHLHKWLRPDSYDCSLCELTHDFFGQRQQWKAFIKETGSNHINSLHKDEFEQKHSTRFDYPVVLGGSPPKVYIDRVRLNEMKSIDELVVAMTAILEKEETSRTKD